MLVSGNAIRNSDNTPIDADGALFTQFGDTGNIDAFGRVRVSNPQTLFDSKNIFNDSDIADTLENQPLFFDNQQTGGTGTSTAYNANQASQSISVSANTSGTRVRQSKIRFNYQPGKSMLVLLSFVFPTQQTGITIREGMFDAQNGMFLENNGSEYRVVRRTYTSGSAVDNAVSQASWNLDTMDGNGASGIDIDFTKTQIAAYDYEWLGVGRVRFGFVIDGRIIYAHEFLHANSLTVVYMSTPNLPIRSEISNDGNGGAATLTQICSTVISEGGQTSLGSTHFESTNGTHIDLATENQLYALMGIRLKSNYIGETVDIISTAVQIHTASDRLVFQLVLNPTVTGTFTYADISLSGVQIGRSAGAAATASGGTPIGGGFVESGGPQAGSAGSAITGIINALRLGSMIDGTVDEIVLCARPIGGSSNVDVECAMTWQEYN